MTLTAPAPAVSTPAVATRRTAARPAGTRVGLDASTLQAWGQAVELDGIDAHEDAAARVVEAATDKGLRPVLIEILADREEPAAARVRAFGRLTFALAR